MEQEKEGAGAGNERILCHCDSGRSDKLSKSKIDDDHDFQCPAPDSSSARSV